MHAVLEHTPSFLKPLAMECPVFYRMVTVFSRLMFTVLPLLWHAEALTGL